MMYLTVLLEAAATDLTPIGYGMTAIGAAIIIVGAAIGIGNIGRGAMEAIARQPEATSKLSTNMIISSALIEGVSLFALVICFLIILMK